ncbi:hypothetical protein D9M69_384990 [compost metagenome]
MLVGLGQGLFEGIKAQWPQRQAAPGEAPRLGQRHQLDARPVGQAGLQAIQQQYAVALGEAEGQAAQGSFNEWRVHPRCLFQVYPEGSIAAQSDDCAQPMTVSYAACEQNHLKP